MELILKEDVINLGYKDDIVKVKDGYGRNYLIPTGKAVIATESAKKVLAENLKKTGPSVPSPMPVAPSTSYKRAKPILMSSQFVISAFWIMT